jgi:hypothetical protein
VGVTLLSPVVLYAAAAAGVADNAYIVWRFGWF